MSSVIHFRFKAGSSEWSRIAFEGHALSLYELKKNIITQKKLNPLEQNGSTSNNAGSGEAPGGGRTLQDFELVLTNLSDFPNFKSTSDPEHHRLRLDETGETYAGDNTSILKNTSVLVKRVPAQRAKTLRIEADSATNNNNNDDSPFAATGARLASTAFDTPASKRLKFGAPLSSTAAADELRRQSLLRSTSEGSMAMDDDGFGEDPLDESSYIQREEEKRQRERAAQAAASQAAQTAFAAQLKAFTEAALAAKNASTASTAPYQPGAPAVGGAAAAVAAAGFVRPAPARPPPPNYTCHNCMQKGHWKQNCPSLAQSAPAAAGPMQMVSTNVPINPAPRQLTSNATAALLSAYTQNKTLASYLNLPGGAAAAAASTAANPTPAAPAAAPIVSPPELICTLDHQLFNNPMVVPCCFTSFCEECIKQALVMDNKCPRCKNENISADQLRPNNVMARRVEKEKQRIRDLQAAAAAGPASAPSVPVSMPQQSPPMMPMPPVPQQPQHQPHLPMPQPPRAVAPPPPQPQAARKKIATVGDDY